MTKENIDYIIEKDKETTSKWSEHFGGFYDLEGVCYLLGSEGQSLSEEAVLERKDLLALKTGSGQIVYPKFQFDGRTVISGIDKVLKELPEYLITRWTVASWFITPKSEFNGDRPIDVLAEGYHEAVVKTARKWAYDLNK